MVTMLPDACSIITGVAALDAAEVALEVHGEHVVPLLFGHLPDELVDGDPGTQDQAVEAAEGVDGRVDDGLAAGHLRDVGDARRRGPARARDLGDDRVGGRRVAGTGAVDRAAVVGDDHLGAFGAGQECDGPADAVRARR